MVAKPKAILNKLTKLVKQDDTTSLVLSISKDISRKNSVDTRFVLDVTGSIFVCGPTTHNPYRTCI